MTVPTPNPLTEAKTIIAASVAIVVAIVIGYLAYTKSLLQTQLAHAETTILEYKTENDDWKAQTDTANKAIKELQDRATIAAQQVIDAQKAAAVIQQQYDQQAREIEMAVPFGDDCAATKKLLNDYFGRSHR